MGALKNISNCFEFIVGRILFQFYHLFDYCIFKFYNLGDSNRG